MPIPNWRFFHIYFNLLTSPTNLRLLFHQAFSAPPFYTAKEFSQKNTWTNYKTKDTSATIQRMCIPLKYLLRKACTIFYSTKSAFHLPTNSKITCSEIGRGEIFVLFSMAWTKYFFLSHQRSGKTRQDSSVKVINCEKLMGKWRSCITK